MDKIATNIDTKLWYDIVDKLKELNWIITKEYDQFDKEIDLDLYEFSKNGEVIQMVWNNWFEGEIKCNQTYLTEIEDVFKIQFNFNEPEHFDEDIFLRFKNLLKVY